MNTENNTPASQAAGPVVIEDMVKALEHVRDFSTGKLGSKYLGCIIADCNAALDNYYKSESGAAEDRPAGPVWAKATNNPPLEKVLYLRDTRKGWKYTGRFVKTENLGIVVRLHSESGRCPNIADIEFLDESNTQQVFTREQMKESFHKGIAFYSSPRGYPDFETYMNTNYPNK